MVPIRDVQRNLIDIDRLEDDADSPGLSMNINNADGAVLVYVDPEQRNASDVDDNGDVTSEGISESHANVDAAGSNHTMSAAAVSDKPHSVQVIRYPGRA